MLIVRQFVTQLLYMLCMLCMLCMVCNAVSVLIFRVLTPAQCFEALWVLSNIMHTLISNPLTVARRAAPACLCATPRERASWTWLAP